MVEKLRKICLKAREEFVISHENKMGFYFRTLNPGGSKKSNFQLSSYPLFAFPQNKDLIYAGTTYGMVVGSNMFIGYYDDIINSHTIPTLPTEQGINGEYFIPVKVKASSLQEAMLIVSKIFSP